MSDEQPKPRIAQVMIRLPWLYTEPGSPGGIKPGDQGLLTTEALRLMIRKVRKACREGRISGEAQRLELAQLSHGIEVIETTRYDDVGVWAPVDKVIRPRARKR